MYEELDAEVLGRIAQRLFTESLIGFRTSHKLGMKSLQVSPSSQTYEQLSLAINGEEEALEKQREAIKILKDAWNIRAKRLDRIQDRQKDQE